MTESVSSQAPSRPTKSQMLKRQRPLERLYRAQPEAALIEDGARTASGALHRNDPIHGELVIGLSNPLHAPISIHSAVGGDHDGPNPGDYLSAALAGCFDTTLRIIADRLGIGLEDLNVSVRADVDVRGTLCVASDVPIGFQRLRLYVDVRPAKGTPPEKLQLLLAATEHCCVTLQTLRNGVPIEVTMDRGQSPDPAGTDPV